MATQPIQRVAVAERVEIDELVGHTWPRAWRIAVAICRDEALAEDAVQDAFERAFRAVDRFPDERAFSAWVDRVVVNRTIDLVRRERRRTEREAASAERLASRHGDAQGDAELLRRCTLLPEKMRVVVALHYWADMTLDEIAGALRVPKGTVRSRLGRALEALRQEYGVGDAPGT